MKTILIFATTIVNLALICYSIAVLTEQVKRRISSRVLVFLSIGLAFDITATLLMIIGSENPAFTLPGFVGYSSLAGMLVGAMLLWRLGLRKGKSAQVPAGLHWYTRVAYIWWIIAYITGELIVILK